MERPPVISDCFEKTNICYVPKNHQYKPEPDSVYSKPIPGMVGPFIGYHIKKNALTKKIFRKGKTPEEKLMAQLEAQKAASNDPLAVGITETTYDWRVRYEESLHLTPKVDYTSGRSCYIKESVLKKLEKDKAVESIEIWQQLRNGSWTNWAM